MDQVKEWLQSQGQSNIDPKLFEDFKYEDWLVTDPEIQHDGGNASSSATAEGRQVLANSATGQASTDSGQESATMRRGQRSSSGNHTSHAALSIPTQVSPDPGAGQQHQGLPYSDLPNFDDLFTDLTPYGNSSDLYNTPDQDLHLARSPSQDHYPDPPTADAHYTNPHDPSSQYVPGPYLPEAQHRASNMDGFGQPYYGGDEQMFVTPQTDFDFSPTPGNFERPLFQEDDLDEAHASTSRGRQAKGKARATSPISDAPKENPSCIDCGKKYRTSSSPGRCTRCGAKYERRVAQPFTYTLDASVPDYASARRQIFSPIEGRRIYQDDVQQYVRNASAENRFVQFLLNAINVVQNTEAGWDTWSARQQKTFNEKAKLEPGYTNPLVTARLRALYREVLNYHLGGDAVYAVGGDNSGYSDDRTLRFSQRMATICEVLRKNKRVVMDVIEGRGVQGFVSNPRKYHERKASNNNCNVEKKRIMEKGKEIEAELGSSTTPMTRRGKRARTAEAVSPASAVDDFEEGPSQKRMRTDQSMFSADYGDSEYVSGNSVQGDWMSAFGGRG
ncbi:hypothetical protein M409DRAFT_26927 [Zasmidium cellare ATCC 36951]|uniref:Uncharacterized protein n=1 Tax=Zasmidium cellare ATCC 36951 TaxID=1080233 RepID=A0A6A6C6L3_ZASCE|nr:uncharacterized protein M409DRAFT_26927 [Zasmidium cellare ATCC 36951]KAF2162691.1 hypothetical protein M409DRAFT_26927 [Zasmidium cellare ATCC 36951]